MVSAVTPTASASSPTRSRLSATLAVLMATTLSLGVDSKVKRCASGNERRSQGGEGDQHQAVAYPNAADGEAKVHSRPAMLLAARFPPLWTTSSSPNAEPRRSSGARAATAACSAASTHP